MLYEEIQRTFNMDAVSNNSPAPLFVPQATAWLSISVSAVSPEDLKVLGLIVLDDLAQLQEADVTLKPMIDLTYCTVPASVFSKGFQSIWPDHWRVLCFSCYRLIHE